jgi:hypothetical protein
MSLTHDDILADYLPRPALAEKLKKDERTLARWEAQRSGPPVTRIGHKPYYRIESVRAWLKSLEQPMVRERRRKVAA